MDWLILILSLVAGVVGTGLGGVIGALLKNRGSRVMGRVLGFAGGVMAGVVAFEMIPEAIGASAKIGKIAGIFLAVGTAISGMIIIYAINKLLDFIENKKQTSGAKNPVLSAKFQKNAKGANKIRVFSGISRISDAKAGQNASRKNMIKAGTIMLVAIALHNFPEGMAIGASGSLGTGMGAIIALVIAVHNIPEGMAISAPLVSGGVSGIKAVFLTALAGAATILGAVVGLAVGDLGEIATGVCLSLASGAMLYVTFCEILPQSISMNDGEVPSISLLAGLICSIFFVFIL
ncbi:MAG: ZIP family metal transporter [Bacteroides sp.]|nr:ZIP family metal transporter [Bacillota bacterium]MCM1394233.1 ZIP family metal transporter [[Eubacterium] siraeum]MCM1455996.1 ZIP family metal transporter [Bacteroides sp.]